MEAAVAYLISVGIAACGIWIVAGTLAAGSPWLGRLRVSLLSRSDLSAFLSNTSRRQ